MTSRCPPLLRGAGKCGSPAGSQPVLSVGGRGRGKSPESGQMPAGSTQWASEQELSRPDSDFFLLAV